MNIVILNITIGNILGLINLDAEICKVVTFPANSLLGLHYLIVVVVNKLVHTTIDLVSFKRFEDLNLIMSHV